MSDLNNVVAENVVAPVGYAENVDKTNASEAKETIAMKPVKDIKVDRDRNPRKAKAYYDTRLHSLARSIYRSGLQDAIVVSERKDGTLWALKGHRRLAAISLIQTEGVPEAEKAKKDYPAIPADPSFLKQVKVRILRGLTIQDEIDMVMDHVEVVGLDDQEKYLAAKVMLANGFTQALVADKIGMSRSNFANHLYRIAMMPTCVEKEFLSEADDAKTISQTVCKPLYAAYSDDLKAGGKIKQAGPKFRAEWEKVMQGTGTLTPKMLPRKTIADQAGLVADDDLRDVLQAILDNSANDLGSALSRVQDRLTANEFEPSMVDSASEDDSND